MIVCHCQRVTDRQIKRAIRDGANSAHEVARATGAGTRCGSCRSAVTQVVGRAVELEIQRASSPGFLELDVDMALPVEG